MLSATDQSALFDRISHFADTPVWLSRAVLWRYKKVLKGSKWQKISHHNRQKVLQYKYESFFFCLLFLMRSYNVQLIIMKLYGELVEIAVPLISNKEIDKTHLGIRQVE